MLNSSAALCRLKMRSAVRKQCHSCWRPTYCVSSNHEAWPQCCALLLAHLLYASLPKTWVCIFIWKSAAWYLDAFEGGERQKVEGEFGLACYEVLCTFWPRWCADEKPLDAIVQALCSRWIGCSLVMGWQEGWTGSSRGRDAPQASDDHLLSGLALLVAFIHKLSGVWLN